MQDATAGDFQGAIGAALAANDRSDAETWLRQALDRYPRDPAVLSLAARYEQARGDNQRAADYYRASLAAMPRTSPTDRLAHALVYPEQDTRAHRAVTAADLQHLLDPNSEPFAKTNKIPPLPAYGNDPYNGSTPVIISAPQQSISPVNSPTSDNQPPTPDTSNPAITVIPSAQSSSPQILHQQSATQDEVRNAVANLPVYTAPAGTAMGFIQPLGNYTGGPISLMTSNGAAQATLEQVQASGQAPSQSNGQQSPLTQNAPHSLASDAWKGLIFSLMAGGNNAQAMQEIAKIPPDVRRLLEADVDFEQGEATLYVSLGDIPHAMEYLNRVESFYVLHRTSAPAGMEVQHAWLLYNMNDDVGLYPVMLRLDARQDLTTEQRAQVQDIWANWAVRRANTAMTDGHILRGVEILQAASQDFPDNMNIRRGVAGAYARVGRSADALTLFKTIPMQDASSGDYQGAISAALSATDMAQAEAWLRQALARYPSDPTILELAARFEQARGNNLRAADFYRAALAAMPPGSAVQSLDTGLVYPPGAYHAPVPGDLKHLLDPRDEPLQNSPRTPPLPSYPVNPMNNVSPEQMVPPAASPTQNQWIQAPSKDPLPLPPGGYNSGPMTNQQPTTMGPQAQQSGSMPIYVPQSASRSRIPSQPVLIEQSWMPGLVIRPAALFIQDADQAQPAKKKTRRSSTQPSYSGRMNLPASEQNVDSIDPASVAPAQNPSQQSPAPQPGSGNLPPWSPAWTPAPGSAPVRGLRITSQPLNPLAAQVQALFAEQTDGQLTQGSATSIRAQPSLPVNTLSNPVPQPSGNTQYTMTQYTPSAQEAATGAYSAPKQQANPPAPPPANRQAAAPPAPAQLEKPSPAAPQKMSRRARRAAAKAQQQQTLSTWDNTPPPQGQQQVEPQQPGEVQQQLPQPAQVPYETPQPAATSSTSDTGLTDQELEQRNLPPLRGPWVRVQREAQPVSPREEAEMQLHAIESGYSGWMGGTGLLNYRTGSLGYDHLAALEAPFEVSLPLGFHARFTIVAKPVFLDSGQADGTSVMSVQESTTGGTTLVSIPQPIGTLTTTDTTPPGQQNAVGVGGEAQLAFAHLAIAGGYTPAGFLVATITGRAMWRPANGPITFNFSRDSVRDSQLSYAGLRDPAGNTLGNLGQVWGGVVANQGNVQFAKGDAEAGFYMSAGGQYLTGYTVETNIRYDGGGGAYWRLLTSPEYGNLSIGANFFAMHYQHNEDAFTHGMGGYFSPVGYFLGNVPFTWAGHYTGRWHYNIMGALGVQAFAEDATPLWPLAVDKAIETASNNAMLPAKTSVGPNYDLRGQVAYQIAPHWIAGGFFGANNTRNYGAVSAGFSVRYLFRAQPSTASGPTGIFPYDGIRPFTVP
jgi:tetratricopeptide (TPR) repeat protein